MRHMLVAAILLIWLTASAPTACGEEGFGFNLFRNPFGSSDDEADHRSNRPAGAQVSDEDEAGFRLPSVPLPKWQLPKLEMPQWGSGRRSNEPSMWEKFSQGTKNMYVKTRDTLMPWAAPDPPPPRRSVTGSNARVASSTSARQQRASEDKPFYSSLLPSSLIPKEEPQPAEIRTTDDFLSLPRPQFD